MKKMLLPLLIAGAMMLSCNNDDSVVTSPQNNAVTGSWVLTAWYDDTARDIDGDGNASTDLMSQWNGCYKHSIISFNPDGSTTMVYTGADNNPRCPEGTLNGATGTSLPWALQQLDGVNHLVFNGDDYLDAYEIVEITNTTLILKGSGFMTCCDPNIDYYTDGYLKFEKQ